MALCRLCGENKDLRKSHIFSELYYKMMYDEKHRFFEISTDKKHRTHFKQKGLREVLLCDNCEQNFGNYERYVSTMFNNLGTGELVDRILTLKGINYKLLKLHQLSILWRILVSSLDSFKYINFNDIESEIKEMLINEDPGKYNDYGCFLSLLIDENKLLSDLITSPEVISLDDEKYIRFVLSGYMWICSLKKNEKFVFNPFFANEDGILRLKFDNARESKYLKKIADDLSNSGKLK